MKRAQLSEVVGSIQVQYPLNLALPVPYLMMSMAFLLLLCWNFFLAFVNLTYGERTASWKTVRLRQLELCAILLRFKYARLRQTGRFNLCLALKRWFLMNAGILYSEI
jgi:hypothetical protein